MVDFFSLFLDFIVVCFVVLIVVIGLKFFSNLANAGQSSSGYNEEIDKQFREDSIEDSNADGLMGIDEGDDYSNVLFPEEDNWC